LSEIDTLSLTTLFRSFGGRWSRPPGPGPAAPPAHGSCLAALRVGAVHRQRVATGDRLGQLVHRHRVVLGDVVAGDGIEVVEAEPDRKSTRLNSSHVKI